MSAQMTHPCELPGCGRTVPWHRFLCLRHWRQVPVPLQRAVWRTWEVRRASPGDQLAIAAHVQAKRDALEALGALAGGVRP